MNEYSSIEGIYDVIENNPEEELKKFFKEELGISQSPIGKLLKKSNREIAEDIQFVLEGEINKKTMKEIIKLFKTVDDKVFKEQVKTLAEVEENLFKEKAMPLSEALKQVDTGIVGKEAAFLSKELATIMGKGQPLFVYLVV